MTVRCSEALPYGAVVWSAVCDCGISLSYLLSFLVYRAKKIVSEYDQEITQSQTADNPVAPRGRAAQPSPGRQFKQSNQLSLPHQDDCNTRRDIK